MLHDGAGNADHREQHRHGRLILGLLYLARGGGLHNRGGNSEYLHLPAATVLHGVHPEFSWGAGGMITVAKR
jgi:hypothetical protein